MTSAGKENPGFMNIFFLAWSQKRVMNSCNSITASRGTGFESVLGFGRKKGQS